MHGRPPGFVRPQRPRKFLIGPEIGPLEAIKRITAGEWLFWPAATRGYPGFRARAYHHGWMMSWQLSAILRSRFYIALPNPAYEPPQRRKTLQREEL